MPSLDKLKGELKKKADKRPEQFYAVETLQTLGFSRHRCKTCGKYFWGETKSELCGDPNCSGPYTFIGNSPTKKRMDFIQTWEAFSKLFTKLGYTPIKRYPVVARWRDDVFWNNASIYDFQPHVVSGAVEPPANPLVVPQACVRFNDVDNVGITGRHYTSFVMIGQHAFLPKEEFDREKYFADIVQWLEKGMGLPLSEVKFHEDQWGGGGNLGPCMEYFARGLEIGNQVYMTHAYGDAGVTELDLNVLDMGMGQERPAWLTHGTATSYEANMPSVVKMLYKKTGHAQDQEVLTKFLPYSGLLNMEEVADIEKVWGQIAKKIGMQKEALKKEILPLAALYSIADHTRTLLFAITDGALPSNVGGAYNLRVILRRAFSFLDTHDWDLELSEVCKEHAKYLKPQFPELVKNVDSVATILEVEKRKYASTRDRSRALVQRLVSKKVSESELLELYDSQGIPPEMLKIEAQKLGKKFKVPEDFYAKVAARHPDVKRATKTKEFSPGKLPDTIPLYYQDTKLLEFNATVLKKINATHVVLDQTAFYPTGGGQQHDTGMLGKFKVMDVVKQGPIVIHMVESNTLKEGDTVHGVVDKERRMALARNHDAAHIVGGAARKVLGNHIWQAGSHIEPEKGRLDVTHYENITTEQRAEIEKLANNAVKEKRAITKVPTPRTKAEQQHGFTLYQGGYVPGKEIRVVSVADWDVQACGGTHLDNTSELGGIKILKSEKIQDGVVRLEFVAGARVEEKKKEETGLKKEVLHALAPIFHIDNEPSAADLEVAAKVFSVSADQLVKTLERFVAEMGQFEKETGAPKIALDASDLPAAAKALFDRWKELKKQHEENQKGNLSSEIEKLWQNATPVKHGKLVTAQVKDFGHAMKSVNLFLEKCPDGIILLTTKERCTLARGKNVTLDARETLNILLPNAKMSGSSERAVADQAAPLDQAKALLA